MPGVRISNLPSGVPTTSGIVPFTNDAKTDTYYSTVDSFLKLQSLGGLKDVNLSGVQQGNFIVYNSGTWVPASGALGSGGGSSTTFQNNAALINGSGNNYNPGVIADTIRISGINAPVLTGLDYSTYNNDASIFINVGSVSITLKHLNTNSSAANRLSVPWAGDYVMSPSGGAASIIRDKTDNIWRII